MSFQQFSDHYLATDDFPIAIDYSRTGLDASFLANHESSIRRAFAAMRELEAGAIANPDEQRMVGHYWLRDFNRVPDVALREEVVADDRRLRETIAKVHDGTIKSPTGIRFCRVLSIGIGGSALGPQLLAHALGSDARDRMKLYFMDNTDPDGMERILDQLEGHLAETLVLVISKSGGTPETRNGMLVAEEAYRRAGLDFGGHAIAVTGVGSKLDQYAAQNGWIARLPMYDWVGGRTSVLSAVGLLPLGLQGLDIDGLLSGARDMDARTRIDDPRLNPAAVLALYWLKATNGRGEKDMVVLPYKDRLELFSRYLQQLVMESLGKEKDLDGKVVEQGIAVYGNKGSTDQHAYVQQLRDGVNNFFIVFIEVLKDGGSVLEVEPHVTSGDYLSGFLLGTRAAMAEKNRPTLTITADEVNAWTLGALIALFERAVGFYATLVNINAYHQPGVEAGKKAAGIVLDIQRKLLETLKARRGASHTASEWAAAAGTDPETSFKVLQHLAANNRGITMQGRTPATARFAHS